LAAGRGNRERHVEDADPDSRQRQEVPMSQDPVRDDLLGHNEEYRRLDEQHHEYETRLNTLTQKAVLTDEEQVEEVTIKKKKLQVKDRMQAIARQVREGAAHP
jgi:uncharacterized protein YdcH (DUF465 family)